MHRGMRASGVLLLLAGLCATVRGAPAAEPAWGEAVEGVQVRLRAHRAQWKTGEPLSFEIDARNTAARDLYLQSDQWYAEMQDAWAYVDGQAYRATKRRSLGRPSDAGFLVLHRGKVHEAFKFTLDENQSWRSIDDGRVLGLKPGKHTIRFSFLLLSKPLDREENRLGRVLSNPVEIEVLPAEAAAPAGEAVPRERGVRIRQIDRDIDAFLEKLAKVWPKDWHVETRTDGKVAPLYWPPGDGTYLLFCRKGARIVGKSTREGGDLRLWIMQPAYAATGVVPTGDPQQAPSPTEIGRIGQRRVFAWGSALWSAGVPGAAWPTVRDDLKAAMNEVHDSPWGEAVDGVQVRLIPDKVQWKTGEVPALTAEVRNQGRTTFHLVKLAQAFHLEVNGQWYVWRGPAIAYMIGRFEPAQQWSIRITLGNHWHGQRAEKPLEVSPGKYTVRVAHTLTPIAGAGNPIRVVSNPVEIEILPGETKGPADLTEADVDRLVKELDSKEFNVRWRAAATLAKSSDRRAYQVYRQWLRTTLGKDAKSAHQALLYLRDVRFYPRLVPDVIALLDRLLANPRNNEGTTRRLACQVLGRCRDTRAVPVLLKALADPYAYCELVGGGPRGHVEPLYRAVWWDADAALRAITGADPIKPPFTHVFPKEEDREATLAAWRKWWERNKDTPEERQPATGEADLEQTKRAEAPASPITAAQDGAPQVNFTAEDVAEVYLTGYKKSQPLRVAEEFHRPIVDALKTAAALRPGIPLGITQEEGVLFVLKNGAHVYLEGQGRYWICREGIGGFKCAALGEAVEEAYIPAMAGEADRIVVAKAARPTDKEQRIEVTKVLKGDVNAGVSQKVSFVWDENRLPEDRLETWILFLRVKSDGVGVPMQYALRPKKWFLRHSPKTEKRVAEAIPLPEAWGDEVNGLKMGLRLRKTEIKPGEDLPVEVCIRNVGTKDVTLLQHRYNIYDYYEHTTFHAVLPDGITWVAWKPALAINEYDFPLARTLKPGESYIHTVRLDKWGATPVNAKEGDIPAGKLFANPGDYRITSTYEVKANGRVRWWTGTLNSDTVVVRVLPKPGQQPKAEAVGEPVEIGWVFVNGLYIEPPYRVTLDDEGVKVNGHLPDKRMAEAFVAGFKDSAPLRKRIDAFRDTDGTPDRVGETQPP